MSIDRSRLVGQHDRGRVELVDDGWSVDPMSGQQGFPPPGGDLPRPRAVEDRHSRPRRGRRGAGARWRELWEVNVVHEALGTHAQIDNLNRRTAIGKRVEFLVTIVKGCDQAFVGQTGTHRLAVVQ